MNQTSTDSAVANLVTKISLGIKSDSTPVGWLVKSMMSGSNFPGFISAEILPPDQPDTGEWTLIQRFLARSQADTWQQSEQHLRLMEEVKSVSVGGEFHISEESNEQYGARGSVTTAIVTHVLPGLEADYRDWERRAQTAQSKFPGYQGSYLQPPTDGATGWVTLLRFDKPESLDRWFNSEERKELLREGQKLVKSTDIKRVTSSFPGWVPVDDSGNSPPNWKTFLLVLLGLYPIVMLEIRFLMPLLHPVPSAIANLMGNSISVAGTTWLTMPLFIKWFSPWLFTADKSWQFEAKWLTIIFALFAAEVGALWHLLS